jgi:hypothetical protein
MLTQPAPGQILNIAADFARDCQFHARVLMKAKLIKKTEETQEADKPRPASSKTKKKRRGRRGGPAVDAREAFNNLFTKKQ